MGALASGQRAQFTLRTQTAAGRAELGALTLALNHTLVLLANLLAPPTAAGDGRSVAVVAVDADQIARHAVDLDVLHDDLPGAAVVGAIAAGAVQLAGIHDGVVLDGDRPLAVVLDDLILGLLRAAALDEGVAVAEEGDGVLADVTEPDVGEGAGALAVDALKLVLADNDVAELGAILEDEDRVGAAGVLVAVARAATVVLLVAAVEGALDDGRGGERDDVAGAGGDFEGLGCAQAG